MTTLLREPPQDRQNLFGATLLVEDDPGHARLIARALRTLCHSVVQVSTYAEARTRLAEGGWELIITDLNLPDARAAEHVPDLLARAPAPVVVLTSSTSVEHAVEAMRQGARDFIVKNFSESFDEILQLSLGRVHRAVVVEREKLRLEREMEALRAAIERSDDALAVIGGDNFVKYCNSAFTAFVSLCGGAWERLDQLLSEDRVQRAQQLSSQLIERRLELAPGAVWHTECALLGEPARSFSVTLSAVREAPHGGGSECVLWLREITDQKRRERFQREILSTTTHDLKGPLGAIMLSAELLDSMVPAGTKAHELTLRIGSSARSGLTLIDEFLSARRIQEGNFILRPTITRVRPLLSESVSNNRAIAESKQIVLTCECTDETEGMVDKPGFVRVLENLLSNALKFTPKGGAVTVSALSRDGELRLRVKDSGQGMSPAEVSQLFERFSRLERHHEVAGTGLGLFVVKSIVAAHGGRVEISSSPGAGTTFEVLFPATPPVDGRGEVIALNFA